MAIKSEPRAMTQRQFLDTDPQLSPRYVTVEHGFWSSLSWRTLPHTNSFLWAHLLKKALSISQLKEGLREEMGVRYEDHKGNPFLELLEISWATSGFMAHGLPNMATHGQYRGTKQANYWKWLRDTIRLWIFSSWHHSNAHFFDTPGKLLGFWVTSLCP